MIIMGSADNPKPNSQTSEKLSHAYIVGGGAADTLAMAAVCSGADGDKPCGNCVHCGKASRNLHPDIARLGKLPDKREIIVEQIRELKKDVIVVANESAKKAYIINDADLMNLNAQNAFLQILEEPPPHVVFILRTDNPAALLPTVRSRCVELKPQPGEKPEVSADADCAKNAAEMAKDLFAALEKGNASLTAYMFRLEKLDKDAFAHFLSAARLLAAHRMRAPARGSQRLSRGLLSRTERVLAKAGEMHNLNVNAGHISGMICASLLVVES